MDIAQALNLDGQSDPGEIVWAWVPNEGGAVLDESTFNHLTDEARRHSA